MPKRKATTNNSKELKNAEKDSVRKSERTKKDIAKEPTKPTTSKDDEESKSDYEEDVDEYSESEEVVEVETKKAKKSINDVKSDNTPKRARNAPQKIECIAIKYDIPDTNHPNHFLHNKIDRIPIDDIIGFNKTTFKQVVSLILLKLK